jgi:NAD(P)-dependent dehydrogenase (short-subunit alcohol dehydrogenase family)
VVIGGASGIGAAVVARLRSAETPLVVWDRRGPADITCDITDGAAIDAAVVDTVERVGVPEQVTITAGVGHSGPLASASPDEWDRVMAVNAKGVWLAMRGLGRSMVDAGRGSIVCVSSVSSRLADPTMGLYCASKAALDMVVKVAAVEWAPVRVNAVAPGVTDTPMLGPLPRTGAWLSGVAGRTPLGKLGRPEEIADAIEAVHSMTWVTGQVLVCDGGLALHSPIAPPQR